MNRDELKQYIASHCEGKLVLLETGRFDPSFEIKPADLLTVAKSLHDDENLKFDFLCNISGVDTGEHFEVFYSVASISKNLRLDFKFSMPYGGAQIESVQEIWLAANWFEREIWELFGIQVNNHGNLKRFLLPDDWDQGHPMRKDWDAPDFKRLPEV